MTENMKKNNKIIIGSYTVHLLGWLFIILPPLLVNKEFLALSRMIVLLLVGFFPVVSAFMIIGSNPFAEVHHDEAMWPIIIPIFLAILEPFLVAVFILWMMKAIKSVKRKLA